MKCLNLRGEMAKRQISIDSLAEFLGIHRNSIANKLNGHSSFSIDEAMKIQEQFFPDLELRFLFRKE